MFGLVGHEERAFSLVGLNLSSSGLVGRGKCEIPTSSVREDERLHMIAGLEGAEDKCCVMMIGDNVALYLCNTCDFSFIGS